MGCYPPLAKFVSRALRKCNGRERWREEKLDYAMAYPPGPPMETHYMRPVARSVTFASNNNVYVIPQQKTPPPQQQEQEPKQSTPEPPQQPQTPPQQAEPDHHDTPPPQPEPQPPAPEQEKAPDAPPPPAEPKPPKGPKRGKNKKAGGRVRFGPEPPPPQEEQQPQEEQHAPDPGNGGDTPGHQGQRGDGPQGPVPSYLLRYTPSPLPRWEATPRRHEYFSGEYRSYYPTPVREGIYRIATDANRLTTIFSEENPNACAIV